MADMPKDHPSRTCKCLNVRIWPVLHAESPPNFLMAASGDSEYTLTYVGERGIFIVGRTEKLLLFFNSFFLSLQTHPQVTMRTRKIGPPIADSSRCIRYTTLTCLLCQTVAYRVQQLVASDVDPQEGPLLPSPDWVEQETLLSSCGWIEVHKDCLVSGSTGSLLSAHWQEQLLCGSICLLSYWLVRLLALLCCNRRHSMSFLEGRSPLQ